MRPTRYETCTIWRPGAPDDWGNFSYNTPTVYKCSVRNGGMSKLVNSKGVEFIPKDTYWIQPEDFVFGAAGRPVEQWMIAEGDHRNETVPANVGGSLIKGVTVHRHTKFGQSESWVVGT